MMMRALLMIRLEKFVEGKEVTYNNRTDGDNSLILFTLTRQVASRMCCAY